jgi:predicted Fe-S protein YdhL (DUF1289 family)
MDIYDDWRMQGQIDYLKGVDLMRSKWLTLDENWDHDHCMFCKVTLDASTEVMAYCTEDYYTWVCEKCYNDFKEVFEWALVENQEDDDEWEWVIVNAAEEDDDAEEE